MTMQSSNLLPALQELPGGESGQHRSFRDHITDIVSMDRAMSAAEFATAATAGLWFIFDDRSVMGINIPGTGVNVHDNLTAAYEAQYPGLAADQSLHDQWQEMMDRGPDAMDGFINGLKGKVAEFNASDLLEPNGYTNVSLHPDPTNEGWDISAINPDGEPVTISVKTGTSYSSSDVEGWMAEDPDVVFAFGSELYRETAESGIDTANRVIADIGPDYALVDGIQDSLNTLSGNMGLDIPDGVVDLVPYAGAIFAASRLLMSVLKTEKEFKAADRTTKNKIQVVQTLTLMSRMGVTTVCVAGGGSGGRTGRQFPAGNWQPHWRHWRFNRRGRNREVLEQVPPTPHAQPCPGHYRADQRRPVLLQEQAAHRRSGRELPEDCQGTGSRPRTINFRRK